jgi:hypothetical protein
MIEKFTTTLMHEQIHIHQRTYPDLYHNIFRKLGFIHCKFLHIPKSIFPKLINNPDDNSQQWVYKDKDGCYYWPTMMIKDGPISYETQHKIFRAYPVNKSGDVFVVVNDNRDDDRSHHLLTPAETCAYKYQDDPMILFNL